MSARTILGTSILILTVLFLAVGGLLLLDRETVATEGLAVNLARRQQVLVVRMAEHLDAFEQAATEGQRDLVLEDLAEPVWLFDMTILALEKGGATVDDAGRRIEVPPAETMEALAALRSAYAVWAVVGPPVADLAAQAYRPGSASEVEAIRQFREHEDTLVRHLDAAVRAFAEARQRPRPRLPLLVWIGTVLYLATAGLALLLLRVDGLQWLEPVLTAVLRRGGTGPAAAGDLQREVLELRASLDSIAAAVAAGGAARAAAHAPVAPTAAGATAAPAAVPAAGQGPKAAPAARPSKKAAAFMKTKSGAGAGTSAAVPAGTPDEPPAPAAAPAATTAAPEEPAAPKMEKKSSKVFILDKGGAKPAAKPAARSEDAPAAALAPASAPEPASDAAAGPKSPPASAPTQPAAPTNIPPVKRNRNVFILNRAGDAKPAAGEAQPSGEAAGSGPDADGRTAPSPRTPPAAAAPPPERQEPAQITQEELDAALDDELGLDQEPPPLSEGEEPAVKVPTKKSKNVFILNP